MVAFMCRAGAAALIVASLSVVPARADDEKADKVNRMVELLGSPNFVVRRDAANALGAMGADAKAAVPALKKRIADGQLARLGLSVFTPVDASRSAALAALAKIAPDE